MFYFIPNLRSPKILGKFSIILKWSFPMSQFIKFYLCWLTSSKIIWWCCFRYIPLQHFNFEDVTKILLMKCFDNGEFDPVHSQIEKNGRFNMKKRKTQNRFIFYFIFCTDFSGTSTGLKTVPLRSATTTAWPTPSRSKRSSPERPRTCSRWTRPSEITKPWSCRALESLTSVWKLTEWTSRQQK